MLLIVVSLVGLTITWFVYPASIFALAGLRRAPARTPPAAQPVVSVVLATCDDAATIRRRVSNLLASRYPSDRIDVVVAIDAARPGASREELSDIDPRVKIVGGDAPGG